MIKSEAIDLPLLRALAQEKDWRRIDALIDFVPLSSDLAEVAYFKIAALLNLADKRHSSELRQLLQHQIDVGHNVTVYQNVLLDIMLECAQYEQALSLLLSLPTDQQQGSGYFHKLILCAKAVSNKTILDFAIQQYHYCAAIELTQAGQHEQANRFLQEIANTEPDKPYYRWLLASNYQLLRQYKAACDMAQSLTEDFAEAGLRIKLQIASSKAQTAEMKCYAEALLDIVANDIQALHALASAAAIQHNLLAALQQYQAILALYPFDVLASLQSIYLSKQLAQRPLTTLDEQYSEEECLLLSKALFNAGYKEYALSIVEQRCSVAQPQQEAWLLTADFCAQMHGNMSAFNRLEKHMANWLHWPQVCFQFARYGIAVIDEMDKDNSHSTHSPEYFRDVVLACLEQALPDLNNDQQIVARYLMQEARYHLTRNFIYLTVEEYPGAEADYLAYAGLFSRDGLAYMRLAQLKMTADDLTTAQEYVELAKQRHQYSFFLHFISAKFYNQCGQWHDAIKQATDGINMYSTGSYVFLHIERCEAAINLGNAALAQTDLDIIVNFPAHAATYTSLAQRLENLLAEGESSTVR